MAMEVDAFSSQASPEVREQMVRNFAAWLDRTLQDESPPQGLTSELLAALQGGDPLPSLDAVYAESHGEDLYSLWSSMTTLAQEVRVQGRLFKQLNETLTRGAQRGEESSELTGAEEARFERSVDGKPRSQVVRNDEIDVLLDLRDRVERGVATARQASAELTPARLPRLARWLGIGRGYARHVQDILSALTHGYSLTLARLDEALVNCGVDRIACLNQAFDPQRMTAIEILETDTVPEGTVVEVYRDGYEWDGKVYRSAQVKVARRMESNQR